MTIETGIRNNVGSGTEGQSRKYDIPKGSEEHSQRLESLGLHASELAHDINNLLNVVIGNADLIIEQLPADHAAVDNITQIQTAVEHTADLTQQVLSYGRKTEPASKAIDISRIVIEMEGLLDAVVSKKTVLLKNLAQNIPIIMAKLTQIRQIILNLVTNASEALAGNNGVVTITIGCIHASKQS